MVTVASEIKEKSMFYQLVINSEDLVGMIAYSLYKIDKTKFIDEHKATEQGLKPSIDKLDAYQQSKIISHSINEYKIDAQDILVETVNILLEDRITELNNLEKNIKTKETELQIKIAEYVKKNKELSNIKKSEERKKKYCKAVTPRGFWSGVGQSLVASVILIILTVFLALSLKIDTITTILETLK